MFDLVKRWRERRAEKQTAYNAGQDAGKTITEPILAFLDGGLPRFSSHFLEVFCERLKSIYDEPDHKAQVVAIVEWNVFLEKVAGYVDSAKKQTIEALPELFQIGRELGIENQLIALIEAKAIPARDLLIDNAYVELARAYSAAERNDPIPDGMSYLAKAAYKVDGLPKRLGF